MVLFIDMAEQSKKVIIAGGTGFLGRYLAEKFSEKGFKSIVVSRKGGDITWTDKAGLTDALNGASMVINLAGSTINCRHTSENKALILNSRIDTTRLLGDAIKECLIPPPLWINASTASIYGTESGRASSESDPLNGTNFFAMVSKAWEDVFFGFRLSETRQVALRISLILGHNGGVFPVLKRLTKMGLGGKQGNGKQVVSWVHIEDVYRMICFIYDHTELNGAVNCASERPVANGIWMKAFRRVLCHGFGLPAQEWMIKLGTAVMGTEPSLVLNSMSVAPRKLIESGFVFKYNDLEAAIQDLSAR